MAKNNAINNDIGVSIGEKLALSYTDTGAPGEEVAVGKVDVNNIGATGGEVYGSEVVTTGISSDVTAVKAGASVSPLKQFIANADTILNIAVDVTAALAKGGAGNITTFVADNDTMTIGDSAKFSEISFTIGTIASGGGIGPTFEFSTGVGTWTVFSPTDGTNGMRNTTGIVLWSIATIPAWVVGAGAKYLIRITRTQNGLATVPIINEVQKTSTPKYGWDKTGYLTIKQALLDADPTVALEAATKQYVDSNSSYNLISSATASFSTSIDFTGLNNEYSAYKVIIHYALPSNDGVDLLIRTSTNNGASYDAGGTDYHSCIRSTAINTGAGTPVGRQVTGSSMFANGIPRIGNAAGEAISIEFTIFSPSEPRNCRVVGEGIYASDDIGEIRSRVYMGGYRDSFVSVNAIRFLMSTGTIALGNFYLYGIRSS